MNEKVKKKECNCKYLARSCLALMLVMVLVFGNVGRVEATEDSKVACLVSGGETLVASADMCGCNEDGSDSCVHGQFGVMPYGDSYAFMYTYGIYEDDVYVGQSVGLVTVRLSNVSYKHVYESAVSGTHDSSTAYVDLSANSSYKLNSLTYEGVSYYYDSMNYIAYSSEQIYPTCNILCVDLDSYVPRSLGLSKTQRMGEMFKK